MAAARYYARGRAATSLRLARHASRRTREGWGFGGAFTAAAVARARTWIC